MQQAKVVVEWLSLLSLFLKNFELIFFQMKRIVTFTVLVLLGVVAVAQPLQRPKVAVVLSGGGAKGFAHIGVLKVLEQEGIPIDIIVGTSMGSIVGGLYSIGYTADEIGNMSLTEDWTRLLSDYVPRKQLDWYSKEEQQRYVLSMPFSEKDMPDFPNGLVNGQNVLNLFCGLAANVPEQADFTKFPIAFSCISADLSTGQQVILNSGFLPTAIFSSMAIPGVFTPSHHNGHILVDGGIVDNFPTDVAKQMGADIIIGVDLRSDLLPGDKVKTINDLTNQLISFYTVKRDSVNKSYCDVIIRPNIDGYNASSFNTRAVDTLIRRGMESVTPVLADIRALKSKYNLESKSISREYVNENSWKIVDVSINGKYSMPKERLLDILNLDVPGTYSYQDIKRHINNVYGMGVFKRVYFNLEGDGLGKTLNLNVDEDRSWVMNVGMRVNTRSVVSIVLNATRKDYTKNIDLLSFTADMSTNPKFSFLAEFGKKKLPKLVGMVEGAYRDLNVHITKDYSYPANIYWGAVKLYSYQRIFKYSTLGVGAKQEYILGKLYNIIGDSSLSLSTSKKLTTHFYGFYSFDNLNDYYFPTKGAEVYSEVSLAQDLNFENINPIVFIKFRQAVRVGGQVTMQLGAYGRSLFRETTPVYLGNFVAAQDYELSFNYHLPFYGLPSLWATQRTTVIGSLGLQVRFIHNHYIALNANGLLQNDELRSLSKYNSILGGGITYSYKSAVGPIELTVGYSDKYRKPVLSANAGFWF